MVGWMCLQKDGQARLLAAREDLGSMNTPIIGVELARTPVLYPLGIEAGLCSLGPNAGPHRFVRQVLMGLTVLLYALCCMLCVNKLFI